ncbi:MAG TPA: hypothetical protein VEK15_07190 [Vicinamibacteria bacterium]|nr:hypothetical protein [Vicinamibacteria bacterium]
MKAFPFAFALGIQLFASMSLAQDRVVVYVNAPDSGHELRLVRPGRTDTLLTRLAGPPQNLFWTENFDTLYYRVDETVFRLAWTLHAEPEAMLEGTPDAAELWIDADSGRWRAYEIQFPESGATLKYLARIYQHHAEHGWQVLIERETQGCEAGDGSMCGEEVRSYRGGRHGVFLSDLQEAMRIGNHLDRLGIDFDSDLEKEPQFLRSISDENVGVELDLRLGDTLHGFAPVHWVDRRNGTEKEIYGDETGCGPQVGFEEYSGWLLVTSEYTGGCARIVSLADGQLVWQAPAGASLAVWAREPRPR